MERLDAERLASSSEVVVSTELIANMTIQAAKSDGLRPGLLVQFLPLSFAPAIQHILYDKKTKLSKKLEKVMANYPLRLWADKRIGPVNLSKVEWSH